MESPSEVKQNLNDAIKWTLCGVMSYLPGGISDFSHKHKLSPETVVRALLSFQGGSLNKELHDCGLDVTASAFVQRRAKLRYFAFRDIFKTFNVSHTNAETFKGYRVFAVDGTGLNIPYDPDSRFRIPSGANERGYCQIHLNMIYDLVNNLYVDMAENADEIGGFLQMLYTNPFGFNSIMICDRGYESYNIIAHLLDRPCYFLLRVKQGKGAMKEIAKLPMVELDRDISVTITTTQTNADKSAGYVFVQPKPKKERKNASDARTSRWDFPSPYLLKFRAVRVLLDTGEYETLVTNLPRSFTIDDVKMLYHMRWGIETSFRNLKYTVGLINVHSRLENSIFQEIYAALTMYNFCNRISKAVIISQKSDNKHEYKVNFKMAVYLCREFFRTPGADAEKLMRDIARYTEPVRAGRQDTRNIKAKTFSGFVYRVA